MATTQDAEQPRKPLFDLSDLADKRDYIIGPDGETYYLRTDGLAAVPHYRLGHVVEQHDELMAKEELSPTEKKEMESLLDEMLGIVLDAPAAVRKQIKGSHARAICRHFHSASQPEAELLGQLSAWAEAMQRQTQMETDQKPDGSSTTES